MWGVGEVRRDSQGVWHCYVHTAVFKMDNRQGPTVQHGNSAQCYVAPEWEASLWRMDSMCMAELLC